MTGSDNGSIDQDAQHTELIERLRWAGSRPDETLLDAIRSLGDEAVPALIAMVLDREEYYFQEGDEEERTGWAPCSAIQLLGERHPPEALNPLLSLYTEDWIDFDYLWTPLPDAVARYGRIALDPLTAIAGDTSRDAWTRWRAAETMEKIAERFPELRDDIVARLTAQLTINEPDNEDFDTFRGGIIDSLLALRAHEAVPTIIQAFEETDIDPFVVSWSDVRAELRFPPELGAHLDATTQERGPWFVPRADTAPREREHGTYRRETPKLGRNDPCWCGSGKKYKKCHGRT